MYIAYSLTQNYINVIDSKMKYYAEKMFNLFIPHIQNYKIQRKNNTFKIVTYIPLNKRYLLHI